MQARFLGTLLLLFTCIFLSTACTTTDKVESLSNSNKQIDLSILLRSVTMINETKGWALSDKFKLLRTTDGGIHWSDVTPRGSTIVPDSTFFGGQNFAWAALSGDLKSIVNLIHTTDGGKNWSKVVIPTTGIVSNSYFLDDARGWVMVYRGSGTGNSDVQLFYTENSGDTWTKVASTPDKFPPNGQIPLVGGKSGISFIDQFTGWMTGGTDKEDGLTWFYVTHDGGLTWDHESVPLPEKIGNSPLGLTPPKFFSVEAGILTLTTEGSYQLVVYSTNDGGKTWKSRPPLKLSDMLITDFFLDTLHGWVQDRSNNFYITADGGTTWQTVRPNMIIESLSFVNPQTGWAIGKGQLFKTTDGGISWTNLNAVGQKKE